MILLDPDLDPYPAPHTKTAKGDAPAGLSTRSLASFLRKAQVAVRLRGQVSVLLTTDKAIRRLNRQFRGINKATDVLSFPAVDPSQVSKSRPGAPGKSASQRVCGDLAISVDTARKQAAGYGHSLGTELKVLLLHGLLHLAGYDHETDDGEMAGREARFREKFGLPLGLIERAGSKAAGQRAGKSARSSATSRREASKIAQGEAQRNPGKAKVSRARRPVGPARESARNATRSRKS